MRVLCIYLGPPLIEIGQEFLEVLTYAGRQMSELFRVFPAMLSTQSDVGSKVDISAPVETWAILAMG